MKRLTTDNPGTNFETALNFVYGKDGWAYVRDGGEGSETLLTQWAKDHCLLRGCDELTEYKTPEEIDMAIGDCIMDFPHCPVALAYTFATQAVHLRSRLKMYEDILYDAEGREIISLEQLKDMAAPPPNAPLTLEELRKMHGEPIWVVPLVQEYTGGDDEEGEDMEPGWSIAHAFHFHGDGGGYGDRWLAYRRKPEEESKL